MPGKKIAWFIWLSIMLPVISADAQSDDPNGGQDDRFSAEAESRSDTLKSAIDNEIAQLKDHPWAGIYYFGDGMGANAYLSLAPENGFVFKWRGCMGVYDRNYGTVTQSPKGTLLLEFAFENKQRGFRGTDPELVPVRWGERLYLIGSDDVIDFCNRVNRGLEPRDKMHGFYYLRDGDDQRPVSGAPEIPQEFMAYLLQKPLLAEIAGVGESETKDGLGGVRFRTTTATLNVGEIQGVLPGMAFRLQEIQNVRLMGTDVTVVSVGKDSCQALVKQLLTKDSNTPLPEVGWKLTTGNSQLALAARSESAD